MRYFFFLLNFFFFLKLDYSRYFCILLCDTYAVPFKRSLTSEMAYVRLVFLSGHCRSRTCRTLENE